ncbi:DUF1304 family protein [Brachybacterium subflavum]|uniref:DUF1304 family protein n=1 Tax=Brachybacterium subflavum TaxID=2585206 RepID=UPI001266843B|nr:DUF1304 domain-containing protein [Brachybacterium subflavum]
MLVIGLVLAALAALLHVFIFWLESLAWGSERAQGVFGEQTAQEIAATRLLAFNQGFYNLFLGVLALLGVLLTALGAESVGPALALAGTGSMLGTALVLGLASPAHRGAAVRQGALPLLAVVVLVLALAI